MSFYVAIDDELKSTRQRLHTEHLPQRGPAPKFSDAEVITLECAGGKSKLRIYFMIYFLMRYHTGI
jgi:hypothetical protein